MKGLRIGRPAGDYNTVLDARTARVMDQTVQLLSDAGATIVCEDLPGMHVLAAKTAWPISAYEAVAHVMHTLNSRHPPVALDRLVSQIASPHVRERFNPKIANLMKLERPHHEAMEILRPRLQAQLATYFREHRLDALIFPTTPFPAMAVPDDGADIVINGKHVAHGFGYVIHNTVYQSAAGIPSLTVPAGLTSDGLPVGISFDGPMGSDHRLLAIGLAFETLRGPFPRPPEAASDTR
ncbi:MAG: amidase family protein [Gammaproteobacteria bacterium]